MWCGVHFPRIRRTAVLLAALLVPVACGGDDEPRVPDATVKPTAPVEEASPATTVDVRAVPDAIDEAYVQAVVDELDRAQQAAFATARDEGSLGPGFQTRYRAVYSAAGADRYLPRIQAAGIDVVADEPGRPTTDVRELRTATASCIHALTRRDLGPMLARPYTGGTPHHLKLVRATPSQFNPTVWVLDVDAYIADGTDPGDLCA